MTITGRAGLVFIELSIEEALQISLHGEIPFFATDVLVVPLEDSDATEEELQDAIAEARENEQA